METPGDSIAVPDGAALSAYQYFENVRNFLVAVEDLGIPTFEASDLEQVVSMVKNFVEFLRLHMPFMSLMQTMVAFFCRAIE